MNNIEIRMAWRRPFGVDAYYIFMGHCWRWGKLDMQIGYDWFTAVVEA